MGLAENLQDAADFEGLIRERHKNFNDTLLSSQDIRMRKYTKPQFFNTL
jgi:hypothetical protein